MGKTEGDVLIGRAEQTAEQDEQEEEQPGNDIGHHEAAADGAHEAEEIDGCLVRQEADQEEGEVSAQQAQADWTTMACPDVLQIHIIGCVIHNDTRTP